MAIAGKVSLRDITSSLSAQKNKLHRIGLREVSKSNLAYANEHRSYEVLEELFCDLLQMSLIGLINPPMIASIDPLLLVAPPGKYPYVIFPRYFGHSVKPERIVGARIHWGI